MTTEQDPWTGNPECWVCHKEYEPLTGDGDGSCANCYNGWHEDEDGYVKVPLVNRGTLDAADE